MLRPPLPRFPDQRVLRISKSPGWQVWYVNSMLAFKFHNQTEPEEPILYKQTCLFVVASVGGHKVHVQVPVMFWEQC